MCDFLRVIAWFCDEKFSLKKSCFYLYIRRRYVSNWSETVVGGIFAKDYGTAAKRAVNAGFDVVEIHAGHSYLISQFLSPTTNDRTDEFGGSAENRARFCRMVIDEVRKAVGPRVVLY